MRNLTKTLAVVSLLAPASAQPLGIGDLKLHSALNQKLNAEINLLLTSGESPDDIRVRMAPPEKFDEAGVPWSFFLSKIKFDTVVQPNGDVVVKLSSNEALQEPFLDFLLEVTWTKGNLYREFTVLVDPPVAYEQPVIPVVEETATPTQAVAVDQSTAAAVTSAEPASAADEGITVDRYGPTNRSDTLWDIAEDVKPSDDISTEQMMMAIYKANPRAFYQDNVNALLSGKVLEIPEREMIVKLSKQQAAELFKQQVAAWNAPVKREMTEKPVQAAEQTVSSQLDLVAPVESTVEDEVMVSPEQEQTAEQSGVAEETSDVETESEPQTTDQTAAPADQAAADEMRRRLEKLEQQLAMMEKLLTLKDEQLAALQNKQALEQQADTQAPAVSQAPVEGETGAQSEKTAAVARPEPKPAAKPKPVAKPKPQVTPAAEPGLFDDGYYMLVGGLAVVLLGGLGWLWWRQRSSEEQRDVEESMFASSSEIRMPDSEESTLVSTIASDDSPAYDVGTVGESSFLSEFTPSDFDAFDSDMNEVDPISEADVYLAYGRYQQAEELMRQAIADEPERDDCKLKLLEIFYANENQEAFEDYVRELVKEGKQADQAFWSKVSEMGNEIIPGSSILAATGEVDDEESEKTATSAEGRPGTKEEDLGIASFGNEFDRDEEALQEKTADDSNNDDLDFDLSAFDEPEPNETEEDKTAASADDEIESVEFDLSAFEQNDEEEEAKPVTGEEIESFDFTAGDEEARVDAESIADSVESDDESLEDFDFSTIEESVGKQNAEQESEEGAAATGGEEFDFNFDFDDTALSGSDATEEEEGVSDLTDMDEFETKIDLAKAYIDMGDAEAAKLIAEEVIEKGSDQQKQSAQAILDQLN